MVIHLRYLCPSGHVQAEHQETDQEGKITVDGMKHCDQCDQMCDRYETWTAHGEFQLGEFTITRTIK